MRVLIATHGTRGDVQPFAALAQALTDSGHEAVLAAPAWAAPLAEPHGVEFAPVHDGWDELMGNPVVRETFETNFRGLRGARLGLQTMRTFQPIMARVLDDMAAVAGSGADVVVSHANTLAHELGERLGVPAVPACLEPTTVPTRAFANPMVPFRVPRAFNRVSFRATNIWIRGIAGERSSERWRRNTLQLPPRRRHRDVLRRPDGTPATILQAFSPLMLPDAVDYPAWAPATGFWFLPHPPEWTPPAALVDFLADPEPPVYIGFGSLVGTDPARTGRVVSEAIRATGVRAVVDAAWGGIRPSDLDSRALAIDPSPFDWLLPRVAAVVHHGGIGTTAAALAAGRPQVVCPFMTGQHFYAQRMHAIGVAPTPVPQHEITSDGLARAIDAAVSQSRLAAQAERLGGQIRAEDGTAMAVKVLEEVAA